jgi:hypothetical protein
LETSPGSGIILSTPLLDTIQAVFDAVTSVDNFQSKDGILVYPNPARDVLHIEGVGIFSDISIFDNSGARMNVFTNGKIVDVSGFPVGVYFVAVKTDEGNQVLKFIKN